MLGLLFLLRRQLRLWGISKHPLELCINILIELFLQGPLLMIMSIWLAKNFHLHNPLILDLTYELLFL